MKNKTETDLCATGSRNKKTKSIIEKRRRARINACLEELKTMVTKHKTNSVSASKLEKADILELTLHCLRDLQNQGKSDYSCHSRDYREGYSACASTVLRFFEDNKFSDNHSTTCLQMENLQTWMTQQQRKVENDNRQNDSDLDTAITESQSVDYLNHRTTLSENCATNESLEPTVIGPIHVTNASQQWVRQKSTDIQVARLPDVDQCMTGQLCNYLEFQGTAASETIFTPHVNMQDDKHAADEHTTTAFNVALIMPSAHQNPRTLVPLYGVIIPKTDSSFCSEKHANTGHKISDQTQNFEAILNKGFNQCTTGVNNDCCFNHYSVPKCPQNCIGNKTDENTFQRKSQTSFPVDINNNVSNDDYVSKRDVQYLLTQSVPLADSLTQDINHVSGTTRQMGDLCGSEENDTSRGCHTYKEDKLHVLSSLWRPW